MIVDDGAKDESDQRLLEVLHDYTVDMLTNTYSPLIEEVYEQMTSRNAILEIHDRYHFYKL